MTVKTIQPVDDSRTLLRDALQTYLAGRSPHTQRAYQNRLEKFMAWHAKQPPASFVAHLRNYIAHLQDDGLSARSVQAHVNTIKGFLRTAAALDKSGRLAVMLPTLDLAKPPTVRGHVQGNRLTVAQRQALINLPGTDTHKGRRDTAILVLMSVCGLRRAEVVSLNWEHIAELDGHKVVKNLTGKHGRTRTVKMPVALWRLIWAYARRAELDTSPRAAVFVRIRRGDTVQRGRRLTSSAIGWLVDHYTRQIGFSGISPHDLRRTAAKLARQGGASIEQVQVMLGHASPQTTSAYIGETLDLDDHAVDYSNARINY
jgi:site-specific recombinase XerD